MKKVIILTFFLLILASFAYADNIYLKSGKVVAGKIIEEDAKYLRIDIGNGVELRYYFDEIAKVERSRGPEAKVFELKPSPLLPAQTEQEPKVKIPLVPQQGAGQGAKGSLQDRSDIERIVNEYLAIVSKPLVQDKSLQKETFKNITALLDVDNMPTYSVFKSAIEAARKLKPEVIDKDLGGSSLKDRFIESLILSFQNRYINSANKDAADFKIKNIDFLDNQNQASATVGYAKGIIKLKLHKIDSKWSIYSTD